SPMSYHRPRMTGATRDILGFALEKIEIDLAFMMDCLRDVLVSVGEEERARRLPFAPPANGAAPVDVRDARDAAALSLAFQILNLVEENAAAQSRRLGETSGGLASEPGLWGQNLRQLLAQGYDAAAIAET